MFNLADQVASALRCFSLKELDDLVQIDGVSVLSDPRLFQKRSSISSVPEAKRVRLSVGGSELKGKEICEELWDRNPNGCQSLLANESFRNRFPVEWRALRALR